MIRKRFVKWTGPILATEDRGDGVLGDKMTRAGRQAASEKRRARGLVDSSRKYYEYTDEQYDRSTAIHESAHMIVAYAVGTTASLKANIAISVLLNGSIQGFARHEIKGIAHGDNAVISFSGAIGEREAFPNAVSRLYIGDASNILYGCVCAYDPQIDVKIKAYQSLDKSESCARKLAHESIMSEHGDSNFFMASILSDEYIRLSESPRKSELYYILKPYHDAIHALVNFSSEELRANGCLEYFKDLDGFEFLAPIAIRSWKLVRENFPAITALADEIQIRKQMSGKEVHEFVTNLLRQEVTA